MVKAIQKMVIYALAKREIGTIQHHLGVQIVPQLAGKDIQRITACPNESA